MVPGPDIEEIRAALSQGEAEEAFWTERYPEYLKDYAERWVAVDPEKRAVIDTNPNLLALVAVLKTKGWEPQRAWVRYISVHPPSTLHPA